MTRARARARMRLRAASTALLVSGLLAVTAVVPGQSAWAADPWAPIGGTGSLVAPAATTVDLGQVRRNRVTPVSQLGASTVDDRDELKGWELRVGDFVSTADAAKTVRASALGFAPTATDLPAGIVLGQPQEAGSASYSAIFASGAPGSSTAEAGVAVGADLTFRAPINAPVGTLRSTLTFTLLSL